MSAAAGFVAPALWLLALSLGPHTASALATVGGSVDKDAAAHTRAGGGVSRRVQRLAGAKLRRGGAGAVGTAGGPTSKGAGWFNAFAEEESTYDKSADFGLAGDMDDPRREFQAGWTPDIHAVTTSGGRVVGSDFFHESASGGPERAWQTHYPAVDHRLPGDNMFGGPWKRLRAGSYVQGYVSDPQARHSNRIFGDEQWIGELNAGWFDGSVDQYDAFGRPGFPSALSRRSLVGWHPRVVNGSLGCSTPGCSASVSLTAYDWKSESAQRCELSVYVHPTDYDHAYSGEFVEYIMVNGVNVSTRCEPQLSGCTNAEAAQLFTCVLDMPLDKLMTATGELNISAKIPEAVDECPYQGNLLAAMPVVSCMVRPQDPSPLFGLEPNHPVSGQESMTNLTHTSVLAPLKCQKRGCVAFLKVFLQAYGTSYSNCKLKVTVNQTDFDGNFHPEVIEYVSVDGANVATNVAPGKNPCQLALVGTPLTPQEREFVVVQDIDVTDAANKGQLLVQSKISNTVEECASNGYLNDGMLQIDCDIGSA